MRTSHNLRHPSFANEFCKPCVSRTQYGLSGSSDKRSKLILAATANVLGAQKLGPEYLPLFTDFRRLHGRRLALPAHKPSIDQSSRVRGIAVIMASSPSKALMSVATTGSTFAIHLGPSRKTSASWKQCQRGEWGRRVHALMQRWDRSPACSSSESHAPKSDRSDGYAATIQRGFGSAAQNGVALGLDGGFIYHVHILVVCYTQPLDERDHGCWRG